MRRQGKMGQKAVANIEDRNADLPQPEVVETLPDKIKQWTRIVGDRGGAVKHDFCLHPKN